MCACVGVCVWCVGVCGWVWGCVGLCVCVCERVWVCVRVSGVWVCACVRMSGVCCVRAFRCLVVTEVLPVADSRSTFSVTEFSRNLTGIAFKTQLLPHSEQTACFLSSFAKFRRATISVVMSVCPSVRMEELFSHWTYFHEI